MGYSTHECRRDFGDGPVRGGRSTKAGTPAVTSLCRDQPYADDASPTAESPIYIADSDSIEEDTDADSIDYPDEPKDGEEDDDEDPEEDPSEEHEPEDDDDDDDTGDEDEDPTEDKEEEEHPAPADSSMVPVVDHVPSVEDTEAFETDESAPTPRSPHNRVPFSQTRLCRARKTVRLEPPMSASMEARIVEHVVVPIPPTNPTYDQAPLGHRVAMIRMRDDILEEDMPPQRRFVLTAPPPGCDVAESSAAAARAPRGQYDFVDVVESGQGLIRSPGHDARTIARVADRVEDVGYVRALQVSEHRMMTSIEEVNLRVSYQEQVRRKKSENFYTQLLDARTNRRDIRLEIDIVRGQRALLARLETLETHMSHMEWQRQPLNFKGTEGVVGFLHLAFPRTSLNVHQILADETAKIDKYIGGLPDNIHGNVMSARPKTLDFSIELANDLMDQKLRTYAERQNENKRKADDSSRNHHLQQPTRSKM
ncbi:hypothetical protein Tco_1006235 [Tanacetum coccineum]|uniref:Uncharacterized protein n=1 Tax=Tanacetum coccineum TaxID=301880 RepID=A0ABQ5FHD7_9ASTR